MTVVQNSTFLDSYGNQLATAQQFTQLGANNTLANAQSVLGPLFTSNSGTGTPATLVDAVASTTVTVGLTLNRANDPTALLAGDWATRQAALADQTTVWSTYGADPATYAAMVGAVQAIVGSAALTNATDTGYVSSAADRTIWMTLTPAEFSALFGTDLLSVQSQPGNAQTDGNVTQYALAWGGSLSLPSNIAANVNGLWVEQGGPVDFNVPISNPAILNTTGVPLSTGPLGVGNSSPSASIVHATSTALAGAYDFPLATGTQTPAVALVEGNVPVQSQLFAAYNQYRQAIGLNAVTAAQFQVLSGTNSSTNASSGELTLDISVLAGAAPTSTQLLYSDLGGTAYNAYQQAFFDTVNNPGVLSSSFAIYGQPTANSPFQTAFQQLFVDGALSNVSVHVAAGDSGSDAANYNGVANVNNSLSPAMALVVGGNSIATLNTAQADPTLAGLVALALQNDPATVFQLMASGLKTLPANLANTPSADPATTLTAMFQSVWNAFNVTQRNPNTLQVGLGNHSSGTGGVNTSLPVPSYQSAFGLDPTSSTGTGRGTPDVSALAAGDTSYAVLSAQYVDNPSNPLIANNGGTSAASPLWAALTAQFDVVFQDQGLPQLGFYNDLLYTAAVIAPAAFNDVTLGNNVTSFYASSATTGYYNPNTGTYMVPTGDGYTAGAGYDLASGLGSPNGVLLARALTEIAHSQTSFSSVPGVIDLNGPNSWVSGANQSLLFQTMSSAAVNVKLFTGSGSASYTSAASSPYAWTSQLAEQSLQPDFDPNLVTLFDKQTQGALAQSTVSSGDIVAVNIDAATTKATRAGLSTAFGFADFFSGNGDSAVRVARPVAVAETAGGQNDQNAVVRLRSDGQDSLSVEFYRVDDMSGTINGLQPGQAGYAAAADARAYSDTSGDTLIKGPSYGNYEQTELMGVNAGDLIAMKLVNNSHGNTYWGFAQANETVNGASIGHLWNYGVNTWGWEDGYGGGDRDYNDLIVGVDFTSASGHGLLK
jgi:hypothetical protein